MTPYRLHFKIPRLPALNTRATRRHAYVQSAEVKQWFKIVGGYVLEHRRPTKPLEIAYVRFVRHSAMEPDYTNLVLGFKSTEDALVKLGVLANDRPANFVGGHANYEWKFAPRKAGYLEVEVCEP